MAGTRRARPSRGGPVAARQARRLTGGRMAGHDGFGACPSAQGAPCIAAQVAETGGEPGAGQLKHSVHRGKVLLVQIGVVP